MTLKLAFNTEQTPALVDSAGYQIGGFDWGVVDTTDDLAKAGLDAGRLLEADEKVLAASDNPNALAAVAALAERRARLEEARAMSKAELVDALPAETVEAMAVGGDGMPPKDELVEAVAATDDDTAAESPGRKSTTTTKPRSGQK